MTRDKAPPSPLFEFSNKPSVRIPKGNHIVTLEGAKPLRVFYFPDERRRPGHDLSRILPYATSLGGLQGGCPVGSSAGQLLLRCAHQDKKKCKDKKS